ncbi:MAG: helix-turn-helix domain-containing protein [Peptostreptococcaceae bacterium]
MGRYEVLVKELKNKREELGLSYGELATRTGLNKSTIQRYELGFVKMSLEKYFKLTEALYLDPHQSMINASLLNKNNVEDIIEDVLYVLKNQNLVLNDEEINNSDLKPLIDSIKIGLDATKYNRKR